MTDTKFETLRAIVKQATAIKTKIKICNTKILLYSRMEAACNDGPRKNYAVSQILRWQNNKKDYIKQYEAL